MKKLWLPLLLAMTPQLARAHGFAPARLELKETSPQTVEILLKLPEGAHKIRPVLTGCRLKAGAAHDAADAKLLRWTATCERALQGAQVGLTGLTRAKIDALLTVELLDGLRLTQQLTAQSPSADLPKQNTLRALIAEGLLAGVRSLSLLGLLALLGVRLLRPGRREAALFVLLTFAGSLLPGLAAAPALLALALVLIANAPDRADGLAWALLLGLLCGLALTSQSAGFVAHPADRWIAHGAQAVGRAGVLGALLVGLRVVPVDRPYPRWPAYGVGALSMAVLLWEVGGLV